MPNRKFDIGESCRLNQNMPKTVRSSTVRPGMYGRIVKAKYDTTSQHTMYTVQVGSKRVTVRGTALTPRS